MNSINILLHCRLITLPTYIMTLLKVLVICHQQDREIARNSAISARSNSSYETTSDAQLEILLRAVVHTLQLEAGAYSVSR